MESILESIKNLSNSIKEVSDDYPEKDINKMREHLFALKEISKKLVKQDDKHLDDISSSKHDAEVCSDYGCVYYDPLFKWWFCDKAYFKCHMDDPEYLSKLYNSENQFSLSPDYIKKVDFESGNLSKYNMKESKYTETKQRKIYYSVKHKKWWFYKNDDRPKKKYGFGIEDCVSIYYFSKEDVAWENYQKLFKDVLKKDKKTTKVNRLV